MNPRLNPRTWQTVHPGRPGAAAGLWNGGPPSAGNSRVGGFTPAPGESLDDGGPLSSPQATAWLKSNPPPFWGRKQSGVPAVPSNSSLGDGAASVPLLTLADGSPLIPHAITTPDGVGQRLRRPLSFPPPSRLDGPDGPPAT